MILENTDIAYEDQNFVAKRFTGVFLSSDPSVTIASLLGRNQIPLDWADNDLAMLLIPIAIMRKHARDTARILKSLLRQVSAIEEEVADGSRELELDTLTGKLHRFNTELVKLQRRWYFETTLIDSICDFIDSYREPVASSHLTFVNTEFKAANNILFSISGNSDEVSREERESRNKLVHTREYLTLRSSAILQRRLSRTSEYDLGVLPKRIKNAFATVSYRFLFLSLHHTKKGFKKYLSLYP